VASWLSALKSKLSAQPDTPGERILFSERAIQTRVDELAKAIAAAPLKPQIAVPVLVGAFVFAADLMRALERRDLDLETEFVWLRSYGRAEVAGDVTVLKGPTETVRGKTVLLIDGVLERGATLARAKELLMEAGAASVISVVLVEKPFADRGFSADHVGFHAGAEFLYGYGMDVSGLGRGIADVRVKA
jgi:hypoxanthine phosphoribosyltransferase